MDRLFDEQSAPLSQVVARGSTAGPQPVHNRSTACVGNSIFKRKRGHWKCTVSGSLPKKIFLGTSISLGAIMLMWRSHQRLKTKKCHMVSWILCFTLWFPPFCLFSPFFGLFMLFIHIQSIQKSSHSFINEWKNREIQSDKNLRTQDLDQIIWP